MGTFPIGGREREGRGREMGEGERIGRWNREREMDREGWGGRKKSLVKHINISIEKIFQQDIYKDRFAHLPQVGFAW